MSISRRVGQLLAVGTIMTLAACASQTQLGRGSSMVTGSGGAAGAQGAAASLPRCDRPLGTAALVEPEAHALSLLNSVGLQSPTPLLRLMMAQSNCFQVVDRGAALGNLQTEDQLRASGMLQQGSTTARGRMVTVQYLITPNVIFSNPNAGGYNALGALGGLFGAGGAIAGAVAGSVRIQEAQTALFLTDAQSGVQTGVAEGSAKVRDFGGASGLGGFGGGIAGLGGIGGYGNTAEGKLIAAALLDAFNKLVVQVQAARPNLPPVQSQSKATPQQSAPAFQTGHSYTVVTALNVRAGAGTNTAVVSKVKPGVVLITTGRQQQGWWQVEGNGVSGWVSSRYLRQMR